jgi:hypothetical protein
LRGPAGGVLGEDLVGDLVEILEIDVSTDLEELESLGERPGDGREKDPDLVLD